MIKKEEPLYIKVRNYIVDMITRGEVEPGGRLLSEISLSEKLNISRSTLRDALRMLEESGIIFKKQGVGTFIKSKSVLRDPIQRFHGITELIKSMGMRPGTIGRKIYKEKANEYINRKLKIPQNSEVVVIERKRTADNKPVVISTEYVPQNILICDLEDNGLNESLSEFLERKCNLKIGWTSTTFLPSFVEETIAKKLNVPKGSMVLKMEHLDSTVEDKPVCFVIEYFNSSKFEFTIVRKWRR